MMRKALFLYQDERLPSSRVRVLNLVEPLRNEGIAADAIRCPSTVSMLSLLPRLRQYDAVILQKKLVSPVGLALLRTGARKLVFDLDDAIYIRDDSKSDPFSRKRLHRFIATVRAADVVIAGNGVLAAMAAAFGGRTTVIPSSVDLHAAMKRPRYEAVPFVVGWVGTGGNLRHLADVAAPLAELAAEFQLELHVVSDREFSCPGVPVRNIAWSLQSQEEAIAAFDVGIMPLPRNSWTEGKCGYKALQYMAAGVPVVAERWGANCEIITEGRTGCLFSGGEEFKRRIRELRSDPGAARRLGVAERKAVEERFSTAVVAKRLAAVLLSVID